LIFDIASHRFNEQKATREEEKVVNEFFPLLVLLGGAQLREKKRKARKSVKSLRGEW
jgi:hypothetical protein